MSEYPKGLEHQAPGRELELKISPDQFTNTREREYTNTGPISFKTALYYSNLISASGGRDTTTITIDENMAQDTGRHIHDRDTPRAYGLKVIEKRDLWP